MRCEWRSPNKPQPLTLATTTIEDLLLNHRLTETDDGPLAVKERAFRERAGRLDFGLDAFKDFYFSRTRRSLEHYYPQALQARNEGSGGPTVAQVNCPGNFVMIGHDMNSSGSDWSPKVKLDHYLDPSGKASRVSVASLKFLAMTRACKDNEGVRVTDEEWVYADIGRHQAAMVDVLLA